jgi:hypothetical protein
VSSGEDVQFDHAKAQIVVDECFRAAGHLDSGLLGLSFALSALEHDGAWTGKYKDDFTNAVLALQGAGQRTRVELLALAGTIAAALSDTGG